MLCVWSPSVRMPIPCRSGTGADGLPPSKCSRKSAAGSMSSTRHSPMGGPLRSTMVSVATSALRLLSQVAPVVADVGEKRHGGEPGLVDSADEAFVSVVDEPVVAGGPRVALEHLEAAHVDAMLARIGWRIPERRCRRSR